MVLNLCLAGFLGVGLKIGLGGTRPPALHDTLSPVSFGGAFFCNQSYHQPWPFRPRHGVQTRAPVFLDACACSSFFLLNPD